MARTFGGISSDRIQYANYSLMTDLTTLTVGAWYLRTGSGGGGNGRVIHKTSSFMLYTESDVSGLVSFQFDRYTTPGNWNWTRHTDNQWGHVLVTFNGSSPGTTPTAYSNGVSKTVNTFQASAGTLVGETGEINLGNNASSARNWAGNLCEIAVWNRILTAAEIRLHADRYSALFIRSGLVFYDAMWRDDVSREYTNYGLGTVSGTVPAAHPKIIFPSRFAPLRPSIFKPGLAK